MTIKDLKAAAELYSDYQLLKELQYRMQGLIQDEQRKIDEVIARIEASTEFPIVTKDETDYFAAVKKAAVDAKVIVDTPVAPDVVKPPVDPEPDPIPVDPLPEVPPVVEEPLKEAEPAPIEENVPIEEPVAEVPVAP